MYGELSKKQTVSDTQRPIHEKRFRFFAFSFHCKRCHATIAVHIFPEVFYMNVISNTNWQKRDQFVLVVKDASGETNICNFFVLPCGKIWIFLFVYQHFLHYLYENAALSCVRLALTDGDAASHIAFDAATKIVRKLSLAKHMLCVFRAVAMRFQDVVYGVPSKTQGSKELTAKGANYGEMTPFTLYFCQVFD